MKKLFCLAGWLALLPAAQAHQSWAPHTHTFDNEHSDLLVLCMAGLVMLITGLLLLRSFGKRSKSSRSISKRP